MLFRKVELKMKSRTTNILKIVLFLVLGILLCCSVIDPNTMLNWMLSISMLIAGSALLVLSLAVTKSLLTDTGLSGGFLIALGVYMLPSLTGGINWMSVISIVMMVIGCVFIVDGILGFFTLKNATVRNLVALILGAALFTVGICLWLIEDFRNFAGLMLGIFFILYSVIELISLLTHKDILVIEIKNTK